MGNNLLTRFFNWYEKKLTESVVISLAIMYIQIPHMWAATECFYNHNHAMVFGANPFLDFLLLGIDFVEFIPMTALTLQAIAQIRKKRKDNDCTCDEEAHVACNLCPSCCTCPDEEK